MTKEKQRARTGKVASPTKHLQKSVGSSRKRNDKRIAHKQDRQSAKKYIKAMQDYQNQ